MTLEEKRKEYKCGNSYKTMADIMTWNQYANLNKITPDIQSSEYKFNKEINEKVSIFVGDITALEIDSIVNAANQQLEGGGGGITQF